MTAFLPYLAGFIVGSILGYIVGSMVSDSRLARAHKESAEELDQIVRRLNLP